MKRILKKGLAFLITLCMAVTMILPGGAMTAYADPTGELQEENLPIKGSNNTSMWQWNTSYGPGRIDIHGKTKNGETEWQPGQMRISFGDGGFQTYLGKSNDGSDKPPANPLPYTNNVNGNVQTFTFGADKLDMKMKVSSSSDDRYVFVDYYVYNTMDHSIKNIWLASATDLMVGKHDAALLTQIPSGAPTLVRGMDNGFGTSASFSGKTYPFFRSTFDLIIGENLELGTTQAEAWTGVHGSEYSTNLFSNGNTYPTGGADTAMSWHWKFNMDKHEIVHKRVAFYPQATAFYVDQSPSGGGVDIPINIDNKGKNIANQEIQEKLRQVGPASNPYAEAIVAGTYRAPFATIQNAVDRIGIAPEGFTKGTINIQADTVINKTIEIPSGSDITILSTDLDKDGNLVDVQRTIRRDPNFTGPIFKVASGATLTLYNLKIDGDNIPSDSPLIDAEGKVSLEGGSVITKGNTTESSTSPSAVLVHGAGALTLRNVTVKGNQSMAGGKGAIYLAEDAGDKIGSITLRDKVKVSGNTAGGKPSNITLGKNKKLTLNKLKDNDISSDFTGSVGVSTETPIKPNIPGGTSPGVPAVITNDNGVTPSNYMGNFTSDKAEGNVTLTTQGNNIALEATALKLRIGSSLKPATPGEAIPPNFATAEDQDIVAGTTITVNAPELTPDQKAGKTLVGVDINPEHSGLEPGSEADGFKVTGTMPTQATTVTFLYEQKQGSISFNPCGGSPQPNTITGAIGGLVSGTLPGVSRNGYLGHKWYDNKDFSGDSLSRLPQKFLDTPQTLYAKWDVDPKVFFKFLVKHEFQSGITEIPPIPEKPALHKAEEGLAASPLKLPGYDSSGSVIPGTSYYTASTPASGEETAVGTFAADGNFTGRMPNADTTVTYKYQVKPSEKFKLTVNHMTDGRLIKKEENEYPAETPITVTPAADLYGYDYDGYVPNNGFEPNFDSELNQYSYGANSVGSFGDDGVFTGHMPNQNVEITYNYHSTGLGYTYGVNYTHDGKTIPYNEPKPLNIPADTLLNGSDPASYRAIYGYRLTGDPSDDPHIDGNSFAADTHQYTGFMPNQDLTLNYQYSRDSSLWGDVTFKAAENGSLAMPAEHNDDLSAISGGFQARVLLDNGQPEAQDSEGHSGAYTWKKLEEQKLVPDHAANGTYRFAKWVVDTNNNGVYDEGTDLEVDPGTTAFKTNGGVRLVFAVFEKDPQYWTKIYFKAENGTIDDGQPLSLEVLKDKTWSGLQPGTERPADDRLTKKDNYLWAGWYVNGTPVQDSDQVKENATYIAKFVQDPNIFGLGLIAPEALGTIDVDGSAVVKVDYAKEGYQYVVTDADGKIVGMKAGHDGALSFPGQTPGTHYYVYEAGAGFQATEGDFLDTLAVSEKTDVLTPVVENNYMVSQDAKDDDKAQIVINPADRKTDYALLDADGRQVIHGWITPSGSDPSVIFDKLDLGVDYVVVARPHGSGDIHELGKYPDGTGVKANILGNVDIPKFIVQTLNGTVVQVGKNELNTDYCDNAEAGDTVKIHAEPNMDTGKFLYWNLLVGDIPGMPVKVYKEDYTFTMPKVNVVLAAHYATTASPSDATVVDAVRGGSRHEMAADPDELAALDLTTETDRTLWDVNKKHVTYKIVFDKNKATTAEKEKIKAANETYNAHEAAFGTAWGLDVKLERYVGDRLIKPASPSEASPSEAKVTAYVQLDGKSADMLDYGLYQVDEDSGDVTQIFWGNSDASDDPTDTGGLFSFQATTGSRYVLALSKAYRVSVSDTLKADIGFESDAEKLGYSFRVRKGDEVSNGNTFSQEKKWSYATDHAEQNLTGTDFLDCDGVLHTYEGWSTRNMPKSFKPITDRDVIFKKTHVYSWFDNNRREVLDKRTELDKTLLAARELAKNYYLTKTEAEDLLRVIRWSQEDYDRQKGQPYRNCDPNGGQDMEDGLRRSDLEELQAAVDRLTIAMETAQEAVDKANDRDSQISGGGGGGGGSAGSGKGSGTVRDPYESMPDRSYRVGVNGNWEKQEDGRWSFALNGGLPLQSMWAWLGYDADGKEKTGWYHFNSRGLMDDGWLKDENQNWYYCNTEKDGFQGMMRYGWYSDPTDQHKYYLDPATGMMKVGWQLINGKWYYFTEYNAKDTYTYDPVTETWSYNGAAGKPYGSMWTGGTAPDGYKLGADGAWIE